MNVTLTLAFIAGLVSFVSPCVLPLVPAYIGYMGGRVTYTVAAQSAAGAAVLSKPTLGGRFSTLLHSLAFVLGFTFIFVAIGLLGTAFVSVIGRQNLNLVTGVISRAGGLVVIFFGLHFMGVIPSLFNRLLNRQKLLESPLIAIGALIIVAVLATWIFEDWLPALPLVALTAVWFFISGAFTNPRKFWVEVIQWAQGALYADTRRQMVAKGHQSYFSSAVMGIVFAAGWTPCIGPIYGSILTVAASGGDVGQAGTQLAAYSLGLGIPFILAALMLDSAQGILRRLQSYLHTIELASGLFLIVIGIAVASGRLQTLSQSFANQFADFSTRVEDCAVDLYEGKANLGDFFNCVGSAGSPAEAATTTESSTQEQADAQTTSANSDPLSVALITDLASNLPAASGETGAGVSTTEAAVGSFAPDFTSISETGSAFTLSDLRGKVILLNFWATWCGPCRTEMPAFENAYVANSGSGFVVVGVNDRETSDDIAGFRLEHSLTFPLIVDENGTIQDLYGIRSYPSTFIIDRDGMIRALHFGPLTTEEINQLIGSALS